MSDPVVIALIVAVPAFVSAIFAGISAIQSARVHQKLEDLTTKEASKFSEEKAKDIRI
jgi:hypothetical protein